jgi:FkbM family methyltransferase
MFQAQGNRMTSKTWRSIARRQVERLPLLAATYRHIRDDWRFRTSRPIRTPFGFDLMGNLAMARGEFEPEETQFIAERLSSCDAFVDVGANIGFYTCLAAKRVQRVVAVEPLRENLDYLYTNLLENHLSNVEVFPVGLSAGPGLAPIYGGATGASLVEGWAGASHAYRSTIPLSTLDTVLGSRFDGARLLIKVDVEGAELGVIEGASRTLGLRPRPAWLVEVALDQHHPGGANTAFASVFERFWSAGYRSLSVGAVRREISHQDVERWVAQGRSDVGHNYEFA